MNKFKATLLATAVLGTLVMSMSMSSAQAASQNANFGVQLVVQNQCTITSNTAANAVDFGTVVGNIATNRDATTTLTVNCNSGANYHVGLSDGVNALAGQRRMQRAAAGEFVEYDLYTAATRTPAERWGATAAAGTANDVDATGNDANQILTVYGRVPTGQSVGAGTYNDTVTATVEF